MRLCLHQIVYGNTMLQFDASVDANVNEALLLSHPCVPNRSILVIQTGGYVFSTAVHCEKLVLTR